MYMDPTNIAIVTVTYNSSACAQGFSADYCEFENIFIIDNNSKDSTIKLFENLLPHAKIFHQAKNIGFGSANNVGLKEAAKLGIKYVLFVNPDCRIGKQDIQKLTEPLEDDASVGLSSPLFIDSRGQKKQMYTFDFLKPYKQKAPSPIQTIEYSNQIIEDICIDGSCFMVRTSDFFAIGGFSEDLFLYCEEDDVCLRMKRSGRRLVGLPDSVATHDGGKSTNSSIRVDLIKAYSVRWSRFWMTGKYISKVARFKEAGLVLLFSPIAVVAYAFIFRRKHLIRWTGWFLAALDGLFSTKFFRRFLYT